MPRTAPLVWIVDDSPLEAELIRRQLEPSNTIEVFLDGAGAIERLGAGDMPDVLVLDWGMPDLSGVEVCRFLRARPATLALPILLLTAHQDTADVVEGLEAGADDYLRKPYEVPELLARVAALVRSRRLVERVEEAERNLRAVLMQLPDAAITVDAAGVVVFANEEAGRAFSDPAVVGRRLADVLPGFDLEARASLAPGSEPRDVKIGDRVFSPSVRRLRRGIAELTISLHDVTEQRRAAARRLDFYSIIAHDLRNPMNAMMLRTSLLMLGKRGPLPDAAIDDLKKIQSNINGLVELINDFLDLARIDATEMRIDLAEADVCELVRAALENARPLADGKEIAVTFEAQAPCVKLAVDARRVNQVVANLLSNAIKFSAPGGKVRVQVDDKGDAVEIAVIDAGAGIPADLVPNLFQRYVRAKGSGAPGTGLGLLIVREIVEGHGGRIDVTSTLGEGSSFRVTLPRAR